MRTGKSSFCRRMAASDAHTHTHTPEMSLGIATFMPDSADPDRPRLGSAE